MPRIKIALPEKFVFSTEIPIYIQHINYGHHLDNAALLMLVAEARVRFFKHFGWSELDVGGPGIVVADVAAQYRSEAFHGETLVISFAAADFHDYGCDLVWQLNDRASGREVARGKHGIVFFDYATRSKVKVPAVFAERMAGA
jgi:4-hydroxybenzoyl-CoA thioesterase